MKLKKKIIIKGTIKLATGLHIGGSKNTLDIGGLDNPVIKTALRVPYIPGSSIKGKLRSLLEKTSDSTNNTTINKMFGVASTGKDNGEITRLIFRDAYLDEQQFKELFNKYNSFLDDDYSEGKWENKIDRTTGKAEHPRQLERVPAGAIFNFEVVVDVYDCDQDNEMISTLEKGFELLKNDYLGGSGSRGYGKVDIMIEGKQEKKYS